MVERTWFLPFHQRTVWLKLLSLQNTSKILKRLLFANNSSNFTGEASRDKNPSYLTQRTLFERKPRTLMRYNRTTTIHWSIS